MLHKMPTTHTDGFVHMHTITVLCAKHGAHRVLISGMDARADITAKFVYNALIEAGDNPTIDSEVFLATDEEIDAALGRMFSDDLPH